uniref:Uncharacterized protein n=1 Tax=Sphingobacterium sp. (strain 21) TaxID=743722 RepID=F4C443_SPHS2
MGTITDKPWEESESAYRTDLNLAESINLQYFVGTLIAGTLFKDYVSALYTVAKEKKANYLVNKTNEAEKSTDVLMNTLRHKMKMIGADEMVQEEIQRNFDLIYDLLALPYDQQLRVTGLITKIKKGK